MSKKKSRLTKTDVSTICEMQRKIDAYENYIIAILGMIRHRESRAEPILLEFGTPMDDWMNTAWNGLIEMKEELRRLKKNVNN